MIPPFLFAVLVGALIFLASMTAYLWWAVLKLRRDSHPPIDLTPDIVDLLKFFNVICPVAPKGWWCSRPVGHAGPCAARSISE